MATSETYARLSTVMQKVFKQQDLIACPELTARSVTGWDSLTHIRFILEVERAFGIKFATPEISKFKNVGELAEIIEKEFAATLDVSQAMVAFDRGALRLVAGFSAVMWLLAAASCIARAQPAPAQLRDFPYPFGNAVSFSSDADLQSVAHLKAVHRLLNEQLGLPISDLVFPQIDFSHYPELYGFPSYHVATDGLFTGFDQLNRTPVAGMPAYAAVLREWHRGNIDQFHSWWEDGLPRVGTPGLPRALVDHLNIAVPAIVGADPDPDPSGRPLDYPILGIRLSGDAPADLSLRLVFDSGPTQHVSPAEFADGARAQLERRPEGGLGLVWNIAARRDGEKRLTFANLRRVEFLVPSCAQGCGVQVIGVERARFTRFSALQQMKLLEKLNVRPFLYTSHGGLSYNQDFGLGHPMEAPKYLNDPNANFDRRELAEDPGSDFYLVDLLQQLGVGAVWSVTIPGSYVVPWLASPRLLRPVSGFHQFARDWLYVPSDVTTPQGAVEYLADKMPELPKEELAKELACFGSPDCSVVEGRNVGLLVAETLAKAERGAGIEYLWYTHFGTAVLGFPDGNWLPEKPFPDATLVQFHTLADNYYNLSGNLDPQRRIWVAPAATLVRYSLLRSQMDGHVTYDPKANVVEIEPWRDPVRDKMVPDPNAGMRDLNGLTVYVDDPERTKIFIGSTETVSFRRNPADATGRPSVTVVDDNTPTVLVGRAPLTDRGTVSASPGAHFTFSPDQQTAALLSIDRDGDAAINFVPEALFLWNTTDLQFRFRKTGSGMVFARLTLDDGRRIDLDEGSSLSDDANAGWLIPPQPSGVWITRTVAVPDATWREKEAPWQENSVDVWRRPPLPIGRIREVQFGLRAAEAGATLQVGFLHALRPNGGAMDPTGRMLVAGRVVDASGNPREGLPIDATSGEDSRRTTTDSDGLFFFRGFLGERCCGFRLAVLRPRAARLEVAVWKF